MFWNRFSDRLRHISAFVSEDTRQFTPYTPGRLRDYCILGLSFMRIVLFRARFALKQPTSANDLNQ